MTDVEGYGKLNPVLSKLLLIVVFVTATENEAGHCDSQTKRLHSSIPPPLPGPLCSPEALSSCLLLTFDL